MRPYLLYTITPHVSQQHPTFAASQTDDNPKQATAMNRKLFLQALVEVKSEILVCRVKFPLPVVKSKGYDTPYLRRRMHLRGPYE